MTDIASGSTAPALTVGVWASLIASSFGPPALLLLLFSQVSPISPVVLQHLASCPHWLAITFMVLFACGVSYFGARRLGFIGSGDYLDERLYWAAWWMLFFFGLFAFAFSVPRRPCFCVAALVLTVPALHHAMRVLVFDKVHPVSFLRGACLTSASAAVCCLGVFLVWIMLDLDRDKWTDWLGPWRGLVRNHEVTWKMGFVSWMLPLAVSAEMGFLSVLCWMRMRDMELSLEYHGVDADSPPTQGVYIMSTFKQLIQWLVAAVLVAWVGAATSATGEFQLNQRQEDMRDEVLGLAACIFVAVGVWAYDFCGRELVLSAVQDSKLLQESKTFLDSEWTRAGLLLVAGIPIGVAVGCDKVGAKIHRKGKVDADPIFRMLGEWDWSNAIVKAVWLGFAYVCFAVGVVKAFTVFLSVCNEHLRSWPIFAVSALMFAIGFSLFMLPPAPGPPVYVVMGIVITSSAVKGGLDWYTAVAWAIFVAYAMKLTFTAAAQKWIGESLANNDKIRSLVGFHTPYTRALEEILTVPQVTVAKSMILCGGPDWVVAVLCGMVKLSVGHVLLAVSPALLLVAPCVVSGAFLIREDSRSQSLAEAFLAVGAVLQLGAGVLAFFHIQETLEKNFDRLSQVRPEDAPLVKIDELATEQNRCFWREVTFASLPVPMRLLLIFALTFMEVSLIALLGPWKTLFGVRCFKPFGLTSSVEHDLGGDVLGIVEPLGWFALTFHALSLSCLAVFYMWASQTVKISSDREGMPLRH